MRQIGMSDESIARVYGHVPDLDMDPAELSRLAAGGTGPGPRPSGGVGRGRGPGRG